MASGKVLRNTAAASAGLAGLAPAEQGPAWNLGDLYRGPNDPRVEADLAEADEAAGQLQAEHQGKLPELDGDAWRR